MKSLRDEICLATGDADVYLLLDTQTISCYNYEDYNGRIGASYERRISPHI